MRLRRIMLALPAPGVIGPTEVGKVSGLARALDAEVELFHCLYDTTVARPGLFGSRGAQENIHEIVARRRQQLEVMAARLRALGVRVRTSTRWDAPAYAGIIRQVQRHQPILLIAHPTERGRAARHFRGRTDFRLIEACPCPVLFIKTRRPYIEPVVLAAVDPARKHHKPAALDGEILAWAARLRDALSAKLLVFHAHAPLEEAMRAEPQLREVPEAVRADVTTAWRSSLEAETLALAQEFAVPKEKVRIGEGNAAETLAQVAQQVVADIVIVGAAARSPLGKLFIGHTAERALDALNCDVLIVKPPGFRSAVSPQSAHHVRKNSAPAGYAIQR